MRDLRGKVAVVTGGGSGIGRALCLAMGGEGMRVVVADIDLDGAEAVVAHLRTQGADAVATQVDVAKYDQVAGCLAKTLDTFGACDVAVNNAGIVYITPLLETTDEQWQRTIDIDLWGVIHGCRVFGRYMADRGAGHIVNTASCAGLWGVPLMGAYSTAKFGVVGLSEALRAELAHQGVGVTAVCPGIIRTSIADGIEVDPKTRSKVLGEAPEPEELAPLVLKAIREDQPTVRFGKEANAIAVLRRLPAPLRDRAAKWFGVKALSGRVLS